jgi:hypothetical protein
MRMVRENNSRENVDVTARTEDSTSYKVEEPVSKDKGKFKFGRWSW